jgi:IS5 family transposase
LRTSATTSRGCATARALREVLGSQLLGARQHDEALAEAGEHRQRPLGARADEREHDVAALHTRRRQPSRKRRRGVRELAEGPFAAGAVTP